jgi:hypothetical protein
VRGRTDKHWLRCGKNDKEKQPHTRRRKHREDDATTTIARARSAAASTERTGTPPPPTHPWGGSRAFSDASAAWRVCVPPRSPLVRECVPHEWYHPRSPKDALRTEWTGDSPSALPEDEHTRNSAGWETAQERENQRRGITHPRAWRRDSPRMYNEGGRPNLAIVAARRFAFVVFR